MDIHKPKAAHSWREFLTEIGTIICGILIALGLEQTVEAVHWSHAVEEARHALGREFDVDLTYLQVNGSQNDCKHARLDQLDQWARGGNRPVGKTIRPPFFYLQNSTWNVIRSGQVAAHFPLKEQLRNAEIATYIENQIGIIVDERRTWMNIVALASQPTLDDVERRNLRQAIGEARVLAERDEGNSTLIREALSPLAIKGEPPSALSRSAPGAFCRAMRIN